MVAALPRQPVELVLLPQEAKASLVGGAASGAVGDEEEAEPLAWGEANGLDRQSQGKVDGREVVGAAPSRRPASSGRSMRKRRRLPPVSPSATRRLSLRWGL